MIEQMPVGAGSVSQNLDALNAPVSQSPSVGAVSVPVGRSPDVSPGATWCETSGGKPVSFDIQGSPLPLAAAVRKEAAGETVKAPHGEAEALPALFKLLKAHEVDQLWMRDTNDVLVNHTQNLFFRRRWITSRRPPEGFKNVFGLSFRRRITSRRPTWLLG